MLWQQEKNYHFFQHHKISIISAFPAEILSYNWHISSHYSHLHIEEERCQNKNPLSAPSA